MLVCCQRSPGVGRKKNEIGIFKLVSPSHRSQHFAWQGSPWFCLGWLAPGTWGSCDVSISSCFPRAGTMLFSAPTMDLFLFNSRGDDLDMAKWTSRTSYMRSSHILKMPKPTCKNSLWEISACHASSELLEIFSPNYLRNLLCAVDWGHFIFISQWQGRLIWGHSKTCYSKSFNREYWFSGIRRSRYWDKLCKKIICVQKGKVPTPILTVNSNISCPHPISWRTKKPGVGEPFYALHSIP